MFKVKPWRSKKYLAFVRSLPCCHCGSHDTVCHHAIGFGAGIMGSKASDIAVMPLCSSCHTAIHKNPWIKQQLKWVIQTIDKALSEGVLHAD